MGWEYAPDWLAKKSSLAVATASKSNTSAWSNSEAPMQTGCVCNGGFNRYAFVFCQATRSRITHHLAQRESQKGITDSLLSSQNTKFAMYRYANYWGFTIPCSLLDSSLIPPLLLPVKLPTVRILIWICLGLKMK